jgi:dolichol-phosphate mannosyltransferase
LNNQPLDLSIVLPAYEEAANLRMLLPQLHEVAASLVPTYEILVIDTETPRDETPEVCRAQGVLYIPRGGGSQYGDAIRTGVKRTRGRHVILMDADGSHAPSFIRELWPFRDHYDLVIASRYIRGGRTENPAILIFLSLIVNVVFRLVLNLKCHDVSNSFRLYQGDPLRALHLRCNDFDVVEEILVKLNSGDQSLRIKEVPFTFEKRKEGKTKRNLVAFAIGYLETLYRLYRIKHMDPKTREKEGGN